MKVSRAAPRKPAPFSLVGMADPREFDGGSTRFERPTIGRVTYVRVRDAAGNVSGNSSTASVTTLSGGGGGGAACRVTYGKSEWSGGFTANVTIAYTGTAAVNGWTLTFSFAGEQRVTNAWNAGVTQSGAAETARNVAHNPSIPAGGSTSFGFQGIWSGGNAAPSAFSLNGSACTTS